MMKKIILTVLTIAVALGVTGMLQTKEKDASGPLLTTQVVTDPGSGGGGN